MNVPNQEFVVHVVDSEDESRIHIAHTIRSLGLQVEAYDSAAEFALTLGQPITGCVILELTLPGVSGLQLQSALSRKDPLLPIIFLAAHSDVRSTVQAMKAGAIDFLLKPVEREELTKALETALALDTQRKTKRLRVQGFHSRFERLTPKEREIFSRVTAGQPNKQIAFDTGMAERTVKAHRAKVMEKMNAMSLADLVHIADELQLSDDGVPSDARMPLRAY